ncbi:hypothetical protein RISK_003484 [Rhodopirellula islandica]|uniref:Transmembrane protein n=1 Tax=Rhodopirellula islandica TaxID=595434 RepID=A0A0J1BCV3_RHOIS|nr:hypothetical protein RISK_003484 [Rhodopirellula islandica]
MSKWSADDEYALLVAASVVSGLHAFIVLIRCRANAPIRS